MRNTHSSQNKFRRVLSFVFAIALTAVAVFCTVSVIHEWNTFERPVNFVVAIAVSWMDAMCIVILVAVILGIDIPDDRSDD